MVASRRGFLAGFTSALLSGSLHAQAPDTAAEQRYEFFSGNVSALSADKVTVGRTILGRPPRRRTFLITADTKVEGDLDLKCRVTVAFVVAQEGDVAKRIIVRTPRSKESLSPKPR